MRFNIILERKLLIFVPQHWSKHQLQNQIFRDQHIAAGRHTTYLSRNSLHNLDLKVHRPAIFAERVSTREIMELGEVENVDAYWALASTVCRLASYVGLNSRANLECSIKHMLDSMFHYYE